MSFYNPNMKGPDWGQGLQGLMQNIMMAMMMKKMFPGGSKTQAPTEALPPSRAIGRPPDIMQGGGFPGQPSGPQGGQPPGPPMGMGGPSMAPPGGPQGMDKQKLMQLLMQLMGRGAGNIPF